MDAQNIEQEIGFYGGIDTDSEDRLIEKGDYRFALNCLNSNNEQDSFGSIENLKGDTMVSFTMPAGTNRCIGSAPDVRYNTVFYFVYNSNQQHQILRYYIDTNTIERVISPIQSLRFMASRFLNFQNDVRYRIWSINIIYTNDQLIIKWVDGYDNTIEIPYDNNLTGAQQQLRRYNPPRGFNVTLATNFTNNSTLPRYTNDFGADNPEVQNQFTDAAKSPALTSPAIVFANDSTRNTNYFRGNRLPQIRYRYVYFDGERSVWSPISKVGLPENDENASGVLTENSYVNNHLQITYNTGHSTIIQVELAVRFGNENDWKLFDTIDKYRSKAGYPANQLIASNANVVYNYYNDRVLQAIPDDSVDRNFEYLPIVAKTQEYLTNNIITYFNITEGYDNVLMDVVLSYEFMTRTFIARTQNVTFPSGDPTVTMTVVSASQYDFWIPDTVTTAAGTVFSMVVGGGTPQLISYVVSESDMASYPTSLVTAVQNWLIDEANATIISTTTGVTAGANTYTVIRFSPLVNGSTSAAAFRVSNPIQKWTSFKAGAWHKIGVVYYDDKMRSGAVNVMDNMRTYIPYQTEVPGLQTQPYRLQTWQIQVQIRNLAPRWAKYYQIVYGKSNLKKYVQTTIQDIQHIGGKTHVNIDPLLDRFVNDNKPTPIGYTFEVGDRIRFITTGSASTTPGNVLDQYIDTRIQSIPATTPFSLVIDDFQFEDAGIAAGSLVELYAIEREVDTQVYHEIGEVYPVLYDAANDIHYHGGLQQNQDPLNPSGQPATVILTRGDTYVKPRLYQDSPGEKYIPVESEDFSDFYESSDFDYGRINADINNFSQKKLIANGRWSSTLLENTNTNGLSSFSVNDIVAVKNAAGAVMRTVEVGNVLKIIQEKDSGSLYVGMTVLQSPGGGGNLSAIDTKLGAYYPSSNTYGTIFPGSVVKNDRHLYFFDSYQGCFIRDSANGQEPISDNKFIKGARDLGKILSGSNQKLQFDVIAYFDRKKGTYEFTVNNFGGASGINSQTIAFHEDSNRWKTYWSYIPEMYGGWGQSTIHFNSGMVWTQGTNPIHTNFFGVQYVQQIRFIGNVAPNKAKLYKALSLRSNKAWRAAGPAGQMYIRVPAWDLYPDGMESRLLESKFIKNVAGWNAAFMGDAKSPNFATPELALMNGRQLQGYVIDVTLENQHTEYTRLFFVKILALTMEIS